MGLLDQAIIYEEFGRALALSPHLTSSIITASYVCIRELWMLNVPRVGWDCDIWCSFCVLIASNHPSPQVPQVSFTPPPPATPETP